MNMTVDVKYLKYQIFVAALVWFSLVVIHSLLTQGCRGSHWWGISAEIRDLGVGAMEMFTLGFHSEHCCEMVKCNSFLWKYSNTVNPQSWFSLEQMQGSCGKSLGCSIAIIFERRVKNEPLLWTEQTGQAQCSLHQGLLSTSLSLLRWAFVFLCPTLAELLPQVGTPFRHLLIQLWTSATSSLEAPFRVSLCHSGWSSLMSPTFFLDSHSFH